MPVLRLQYDPAEVPEDGFIHLRSVAFLQKGHWFEPAGISFHEAALKLSGYVDPAADSGDADGGDQAAKGESPAVDSGAWDSGRSKNKGKEGFLEQDHYALLGLGHLRYLATDDQLKKAYRETALRHHPDKQASVLLEEVTEEAKEAKREEIDAHFKAIQFAYEVLSDPVKRRNYDSTDEFDDDIPGECTAEDFFKVFGPVFLRNGRWSITQPALMLGDDSTHMDDVDKFYDFWWAFRSWREFPNEDEFELDSAESREHKRWMERQNAKLREKAKKEENARIRSLVENAFRRDPRLLRRKEEEKKEKQRKKDAKHQARRAAEEEEQRAAEEERVRREEEERLAALEAAAQKKQREKDKKVLRKEKARLRTLTTECIAGAPIGRPAEPWGVPDDDVEKLCQTLVLGQIRSLCDRLEQEDSVQLRAASLRLWLKAADSGEWDGDVPTGQVPVAALPQADGGQPSCSGEKDEGKANGATAPAEPANSAPTGQANGSSKPVATAKGVAAELTKKPDKKGGDSAGTPEPKRERPWGSEEVELLRKALGKFPKGTSQRWEVVADYMGTGRSVDEILKAIKTVLLQKPDDSKAFQSFLQKRKPTSKEIVSPLSSRDDSADSVDIPAMNGTAKPTANGVATPGGKSKSAGGKASTSGVREGKEAGGEPTVGGGLKAEVAANGVSTPASGAPIGNGTATAGGEGSGERWSEAQEVALVKALKAFPKDTEKRWERIAAAVPGRTKAQCYRKFTLLRDNFRVKREGAAAE